MSFRLEWFGAELMVPIKEASHLATLEEARVLAEDTASRSPVGGPDDPTAGMLMASWHVEEEAGEVSVVSDDPNAVYQEFGTVKMPPQPSLRPAAHVAESRWPVRLARAIGSVVAG